MKWSDSQPLARRAGEPTTFDLVVTVVCVVVVLLCLAVALAPEPMADMLLGGLR